jgi:hypothetical protein
VLLLVREYFNNLFEIAENYPRVIGLAYLLGGWFFAILMALLSLIVSPSDGVTVTRMSLLFASASLAFGPFYVFAPTRPIKLRKQSVLKALATVARKKESRWATFVVFVALTALQGIVAYDLYALLTSISVPFEQVALTVFGYVLLTLFYLVVFYTTMLGRMFRFNDLDVVEHIRKHAFVEFKKRLHVLSSRSYAPWYVALFVVAVVLQLVVVGLAVSNALADGYFGGLSLAQQVLFGVFAVALVLLLLVSISFVLVSAFRPVPVKVATATDKEIERALEQFSSEEREVIALHWAKSQYDDLFKVYAARIPTAIRQLIDDTALELIHMNVRESKTKLIEAVGVSHLRLLSGSARAVLTTSEDVAEDSVDQWLALFTDRDSKAEDDGTDKAARRRVLFYSLAHAFSTPARWAELFSAVADDGRDDAAAKVADDDNGGDEDEDEGDELRDLSRARAEPADEQESKAPALDDIEKIGADDASEAKKARKKISKQAAEEDTVVSREKASPAPAPRSRKELADDKLSSVTNSVALIASPSSAADVFASASPAPPGGGASFGAPPPRGSSASSSPSPPPPSAGGGAASPPPPPQSIAAARDDARLLAAAAEPSDLIVNTSTASVSRLASPSVLSTQAMGGGPPPAIAASPSPPPPSAAPARGAGAAPPSRSARDDAPLASSSGRSQAIAPTEESDVVLRQPAPLSQRIASPTPSSRLAATPAQPRLSSVAPSSPTPPPQLIANSDAIGASLSQSPLQSMEKSERPALRKDFVARSSMQRKTKDKKKDNKQLDFPVEKARESERERKQEKMASKKEENELIMAPDDEENEGEQDDTNALAYGTLPNEDADLAFALPSGFESTSRFTWLACTEARVEVGGIVAVATAVGGAVGYVPELDHPNLVSYLGFQSGLALWRAPDSPPLRVARSLESTIAGADVVRVVLQLAQALQHLHERGAVHGAISSDTVVMLEPSDGGVTVAMLSDFVGRDDRVPPAAFLAPERSGGGAPRSVEADVFALGALLQWALTAQSASSATLARRPKLQALARDMMDSVAAARPSLADVIQQLQAFK